MRRIDKLLDQSWPISILGQWKSAKSSSCTDRDNTGQRYLPPSWHVLNLFEHWSSNDWIWCKSQARSVWGIGLSHLPVPLTTTMYDLAIVVGTHSKLIHPRRRLRRNHYYSIISGARIWGTDSDSPAPVHGHVVLLKVRPQIAISSVKSVRAKVIINLRNHCKICELVQKYERTCVNKIINQCIPGYQTESMLDWYRGRPQRNIGTVSNFKSCFLLLPDPSSTDLRFNWKFSCETNYYYHIWSCSTLPWVCFPSKVQVSAETWSHI